MTMQQQALEPNAVMITTTDEVLCIDKEEQLSQSNALPKKSDSSPLMVDSFSPKSLPNKTKNKPIIPPHKKDTRKLFVGGLGKQGEMSKFFLHTDCLYVYFFLKNMNLNLILLFTSLVLPRLPQRLLTFSSSFLIHISQQ